ncbi:damage-control phosphatase ARMT1 family protein [Staphylothermus hellenicus]|uniref:Damage-control phosphatase ARMT1-like metal-binding domain-containing protein n=1 Tax=Staphylothermus hellenicus (strain DSM 12710 / JCM 10830 / BK20S6-10-b1 / P8) TaxID=591019 RepID=D7DBX3_STAHD|nr:ARMT1-like domain-containing protein [Staphylothermus hellenicus]ADI31670.1 protein of unknown function DUF89 [Staphylothermus hellenicus DSM 12710]
MKPHAPCVQCIVSVRLREIMNSIRDHERTIKLQIQLLKVAYEEFTRNNELTIIATNIFNKLISLAPEIVDYYKDLKKKAISRAWENIGEYKSFLEKLEGYEKFRFATKISIAGNALDTGVAGYEPPDKISVDRILSTPLIIDHTREIYDYIRAGGKKILWLFDNAGESVLDTLLVEILQNYGNKVIGVAKEDPGFQNDLTMSDAYYAGLDKVFDEIISTGYNGSSIHLNKVSEQFKKYLKEADLIIAKGMAHYEYISGIELEKPIAHLLIPKCEPVAKTIGGIKEYYVAYFHNYR